MTTDLEVRLRAAADKLDAAAQRYTPAVVSTPTGPRVSRRTALAGAGVLAAAAVAAGVALVDSRRRPPGSASTTGNWRDIAPSPLTGREDSAAVWTGSEFVVWGGRVGNFLYQQGAAYSPSTDTWRPTASNHWAGLGTATTWTGTLMVVLFKNGGAAYDPATDAWSDLPTIDVDQFFVSAAWTGTEVLGIGARSGLEGTFVATAAVTPGDQSWRPRAVSAIPWTTDLQFAATPTGYAVWRPTQDRRGAQVWSYDASADRWAELPALALDAGRSIESSLIVSTTTGWTAVMSTASPQSPTVTATMRGSTWRTRDLAIALGATQGVGIDGDRVIVFGRSDATPPMAVQIDADGRLGGAWALVPQAITGQALAWSPDSLFAWGGRLNARDVTAQGRLFTP